jgi:uncharacterized damage-inducible protein DinB
MQLDSVFRGAHAFLPIPAAMAGLAPPMASARPYASPHSIAEVVAHMRFWQRWFLDRAAGTPVPMIASASMGWPSVSESEWDSIRTGFETDYQHALAMIDDGTTLDDPLTPPIEFGPLQQYTVRDALTHVALHNAHHLGQIITLRQQVGAWPPPTGSWTW